jgi:hypothetical protein
MTTREYSVEPHKDYFRITIKKRKHATSNLSYEHLFGYVTEEAANLDVMRYKDHIAANKYHSSFVRQVTVPEGTHPKKVKEANESMRRVHQKLKDQAVFGTAYNSKIRGLKNKYNSYVTKCAGVNKPPLAFDEWEDLYARKTPEQRERYFRLTCRDAVMRDQASLGNIASSDSESQIKGLQNAMRYMHQSIERVAKQNLELSDHFNKLCSSIRLYLVVILNIDKYFRIYFCLI